MEELIKVEIAFAISATDQRMMCLKIPRNTPVIEAITCSKLQEQFSNLKITDLSIGIFGKKIDPLSYILKNNDRIEIYRPLNKTPNQKRLERANTQN